MRGRQLVYRYLPLAAVVMIQVLIIAIAPSKAPEQIGAFGPQDGDAADFGDDFDDHFGDLDDLEIDPETGEARPRTGARTGTGPGQQEGTADTRTGAPPGDTSHCVGDRQYDPAIYPYAPRCTPVFGGNNGGNTYRGVEADEIRVVVYRDNLGAAVDNLLTATGGNPSDAQWQAFLAAAEEFINSRYELYGRNINFIWWRGRCESVPPDYPCLRGEMREIVQTHNPFWVIRNTSLASAAFDELSRLQVMNSGGWGFRDSFRRQRRPFSWDLLMGGLQQVEQVAEWYCKRMHGGIARHAGEGRSHRQPNPDLRNRQRVLGVISTDDPENKLAIEGPGGLQSLLQQRCGATIQHTYYYAQDITTAEQQRRAAVETMRRDPMATTIMCFCDLVAPMFLYQTAEEYRYYPEHVMVGTGFMDTDGSGQSYDTTLCQPERCYQFENAFGLAQQVKQFPETDHWGARVWRTMGRDGSPHPSMAAQWDHYGMVAFLLQNAGPNLNPQTVEQGAFRAGRLAPGNAQHEDFNVRSFSAGDYTWIDSLREMYWSTEGTSRYNGQQGTYVSLHGGRWFLPGQYPSGQLQLPPKPR